MVRAWTDLENEVVLEVELMVAPVIEPAETTGVEPMDESVLDSIDASVLELMDAPAVAQVMVTPGVAKMD